MRKPNWFESGVIAVCVTIVAITIVVLFVPPVKLGVTLEALEVSLDDHHFNVTFLVVDAPDTGILFEAVSAPGTYKAFTPTTLYTGDQITLTILHQGTVTHLPTAMNLHGGVRMFPMTIEEEGTTYEF